MLICTGKACDSTHLAGSIHAEFIESVVDGCLLLSLYGPRIQINSYVLQYRLSVALTCTPHKCECASTSTHSPASSTNAEWLLCSLAVQQLTEGQESIRGSKCMERQIGAKAKQNNHTRF